MKDRNKSSASKKINRNLSTGEQLTDYIGLALQIARSERVNGKPLRLKITSSSMSPQLQQGDFIDLEFAQPESLKRGDIVTFQNNGKLVTHRLVSASPLTCLTKGDGVLGFDPPVDRSKLIGRVAAFEHDGKVTIMRGRRWRIFNRTVGCLSFLEGWTTRLAEGLFQRGKGQQHPPTLSFLARLFSGLLRLPVNILHKLLAPS